MAWEPFALALLFGLIVSATLYFVLVWPKIEASLEDEDDPRRRKRGSNEMDRS